MVLQRFNTSALMTKAKCDAESRVGKVALVGRYHQLPKRVEDDFEIGEVLGSGLNGSVYSVKCRHTGTRLALKKLSLHGIEADTKKYLADELSISLSLDHPHVARLHHAYEADGTVSLVMEQLSGGELFDRIKESKVFEERHAAHAIWQMLLAVNYLHHEGLTHRDLKLENFIYDEPGSDYLKLIDFGLSKYSHGKKMQEALGTLAYVAPEVLQRNYIGGSCDMWSLGCIAFVLLLGYMPFGASDDKALVSQILQCKYRKRAEKWQSISSTARSFVERLLVLDPAARMTAKQALQHPFIANNLSNSGSGLKDCCARGFLSLTLADDFTRAALQVMAWSMPLDKRRQLRDRYIRMGMSEDGIVELKDLERQLAELNMERNWLARVMRMLRELDVQGRGELHYSDFLAAMMARKLEKGHEDEEMMRVTFRRFDQRGEGYITAESFSCMGVHVTDDIRKVFELKFLSFCGRMNVEEFMAYLYRPQETQSEMLR